MVDDRLLIGLDIGTTNIKAIAFDRYGQVVASATTKTPTHFPQPDWAYYRPDELWNSTIEAIRFLVKQLDDPGRVVSVGVASIGETGFPLDNHGEPIYDGIAWYDRRSVPQARALARTVGAEKIFAVCGLSLQPIFSLCKLLWLRDNEPEVFARTRLWLNTADYITYRLCGIAVTDYSLASRTLALNIAKLEWAGDLLADLGMAGDLFAPLAASGTLLGSLSTEAAMQSGLPPSAKVAVGGHDHVCGAFALGVVQPNTLLDSLGSAEAVFLPVARPVTNPEFGSQGFALGAHVAGGYYALGGLYTSGACVDWFRSAMAGGADYPALIAEAEQVVAGSHGVTFLPHLRLAHPGYADSASRGAFVGLTTDADRGVLFRAVLEGLAYDGRYSLESLVNYAGLPMPSRIVATGGGTRNRLLMAIKAAVLNRPVEIVSVVESTALGAALLGGIGAGVYADTGAAMASIRFSVESILPQPNLAARYEWLFRSVFQQISPALSGVNRAIRDRQEEDRRL